MKFKLLIFSAILLRLVLAVITYHPDLTAYSVSAQLILLHGRILDFYDAITGFSPDGITSPQAHGMTFVYQPLSYLLPSLFYLPFFPWLNHWANSILQTNPYGLSSVGFYLPLLLFKLPMILADLGIIWLLPKLFATAKHRNLAQLLWAFNPVAIYVSSMIGQIDAVLTFFLVAALVALKQKRILFASILLALSALTKPIALILLPLLALAYGLLPLLVGGSVYLLGIVPYLFSAGYRYYVLLSDHMLKSTFAGIAIASGTQIPWFFIFYALIFLFLYQRRLSLLPALGAALFSSLAFTHFHVQWFLWLTPWLILYFIKERSWPVYLSVLLAWLMIVFSFGPDLTSKLFFGFKFSTWHLPQQLTQLVLLARAWIAAVFIGIFLIKKGRSFRGRTFRGRTS